MASQTAKADAEAAAAAAENVRSASQTQSRRLGNRVSEFLGKIRAA